MKEPIICFGQQPCGFFPKRFLIAKINTARKLKQEIGGEIIWFYHDSDADYRETITIMRDRYTQAEVRLNFTQENKLQKKHSPLYAKRIPKVWKAEILKQLPRFADKNLIDIFASIEADNAADFCLKMYQKLGLLDGIKTIRSSNPLFREQAMDLKEYYADVEYQGETVRAKFADNGLALHEGGEKYTKVPLPAKIEKRQISPGAGERFAWMQSVIHCTHYVYGEGEAEYLKFKDFPEIKFIEREKIDYPNFAWIPKIIHNS